MTKANRSVIVLVLTALSCLLSSVVVAPAEEPTPEKNARLLSDFGKISTSAEADATLTKAAAELIAKGGGVLIIPRDAPANWEPQNVSQGAWRNPPPPAPAKNWGYTKAITILDYRDGTAKVYLPQMSPMEFHRTLSLPEGQSVGHWDYHPMWSLENSITRGTTSYRDWITEDAKPGKDQRIYVKTLRGLFPGMFLNSRDYGNVSRLYVKSLGYDKNKRAPFIVADVDIELTAQGTLLHNKTHANVMRADTYSHTENQTFDFMLMRHNYSQGDNYMYYAGFNYMGDVHSTAGDENGVLYAAFPVSMSNLFRGQVESFNSQTCELKYRGGSNAHTLASGRPMINMNPTKWITTGKAYINHPGGALLNWGGRLRSKDAPWTEDLVGRYFSVDEPDEYVPGSDKARRWYYISGFTEENGVKMLNLQRNWWGAKDAQGISRLYNPSHYTLEDKNPKLLSYIIAPGANVYDVSRGVKDDGPWGGQSAGGALECVVKVAPGPQTETPVDFAPGDPVEQAVGFDPFKPIPFRSWLFENVPGAFPAPVLDIANHGETARSSVLRVEGGTSSYADYTKPDKPLPQIPWGTVINVQSACEQGIVFAGGVEHAAILFRQPNQQQQFLRWEGPKWEEPMTNLGVSMQGDLQLSWRMRGFAGQPGGTNLSNRGLSEVKGLSGTPQKAGNFRGVKVRVPVDSQSFDVAFTTPEVSDSYAVIVQPSWRTNRAVTKQSAAGFTVQFDRPAPKGARLSWIVVQ